MLAPTSSNQPIGIHQEKFSGATERFGNRAARSSLFISFEQAQPVVG
jgi:hypothetical protein